jgi:hypothetical protein
MESAGPQGLPFEVVTRDRLTPNKRWGAVKAPFPTGAWWSNVAGPGAADKGDQIFASLPYQFKIDAVAAGSRWGGGLQVSYGPLRRTSSEEDLIDWFGADLCVRATDQLQDVSVSRFDPLSVDLDFALVPGSDTSAAAGQAAVAGDEGGVMGAAGGGQGFTALLTRGSPYVTASFKGDAITPLIVGGAPLLHWEVAVIGDNAAVNDGDPSSANAFRATFANPSVHGGDSVAWLLFFEHAVTLVEASDSGGLKTASPYQGIVRVALVPPSAAAMGETDFVGLDSNLSAAAEATASDATVPSAAAAADTLAADTISWVAATTSARASTQTESQQAAEVLLMAHASVYPVSAHVSWDLSPSEALVTQAIDSAQASQQSLPLQAAFAAAQEGVKRTATTNSATVPDTTLNRESSRISSHAAYSYTFKVQRMKGPALGRGSSLNPSSATATTEKFPGEVLEVLLPHHISTLVTQELPSSSSSSASASSLPASPAATLVPALTYATLKGPAIGVTACRSAAPDALFTGNEGTRDGSSSSSSSSSSSKTSSFSSSFTFVEPLTSIDWFSPQSLLHNVNSAPYAADVAAALEVDAAEQWSGTNPHGLLVDPKWNDPYGFGKAVAKVTSTMKTTTTTTMKMKMMMKMMMIVVLIIKMVYPCHEPALLVPLIPYQVARLALIAEELGNVTLLERCVNQLEDALTPWLDGLNRDAFVYDNTWGGIISSAGKEDQAADFGNGWYNDHHFHYGYFLMAVSVVQRKKPNFLVDSVSPSSTTTATTLPTATPPTTTIKKKRLAAVEAILRDVANPGVLHRFSGDQTTVAAVQKKDMQNIKKSASDGFPPGGVGSGERSVFEESGEGMAQYFPMTRHKVKDHYLFVAICLEIKR